MFWKRNILVTKFRHLVKTKEIQVIYFICDKHESIIFQEQDTRKNRKQQQRQQKFLTIYY